VKKVVPLVRNAIFIFIFFKCKNTQASCHDIFTLFLFLSKFCSLAFYITIFFLEHKIEKE
jgi:hypothetical protein